MEQKRNRKIAVLAVLMALAFPLSVAAALSARPAAVQADAAPPGGAAAGRRDEAYRHHL